MVKSAVLIKSILVFLYVSWLPIAVAAVSVTDDAGNVVTLAQPAKRIVSLAPHVTELLFSAGAGELVIGTMEFSDYPEAAKAIPRIGSHNTFDLEKIISLKPDLIIVWQSGTVVGPVKKLKQIGIPVYASEPRTLEGIAHNVRQLGLLAGTAEKANAISDEFLAKLKKLRATYSTEDRLSVFYQIWHQPLMTVNGQHLISQVVELCGGENIFADLASLAPKVSLEAVLAEDPKVIVGGSVADNNPSWKQDWNQWSQLQAVKNGHIFYVNPDHLQRHTVRILLGAEVLCQQLQRARQAE